MPNGRGKNFGASEMLERLPGQHLQLLTIFGGAAIDPYNEIVKFPSSGGGVEHSFECSRLSAF